MVMLIGILVTATAVTAGPATWRSRLPEHGRVAGTASISTVHGKRLLVLWVANATERRPEAAEKDDALTCPELAMGRHYLQGRTRLSLVNDSRTGFRDSVSLETNPEEPDLNIPLTTAQTLFDDAERRNWCSCDSSSAPPLAIDQPLPGVPKSKNKVMRMRDINGDGWANEFALYATESCSDIFTTIAGYSERQDKVIWYTFHLQVTDNGRQVGTQDSHWIPVGFLNVNPDHGIRRFKWSYTGDPHEYHYEVGYDAAREQFVGTETIIQTPQSSP